MPIVLVAALVCGAGCAAVISAEHSGPTLAATLKSSLFSTSGLPAGWTLRTPPAEMDLDSAPRYLACTLPEENLFGHLVANEVLTFPRGGYLQETIGRSPSSSIQGAQAQIRSDTRHPARCTGAPRRPSSAANSYRPPIDFGFGWTSYAPPRRVPLRRGSLASVAGELWCIAVRIEPNLLVECDTWRHGLFASLLAAGTSDGAEEIHAVALVAASYR